MIQTYLLFNRAINFTLLTINMILEISKLSNIKTIKRSIMLKFALKIYMGLMRILVHQLFFNRSINLLLNNHHLLNLLHKIQGFMKLLKQKQEKEICRLRNSCRNI